MKVFVLLVCCFQLASRKCEAQNYLEGRYRVANVVDLQLNLGAINNDFRNMKFSKADAKASWVKIDDDLLIVSKGLDKKFGIGDTAMLIHEYKFEKMKDNELTERYPGDELIDTSSKFRKVGNSFLRLLKTKCNSINVVVAKKTSPNFNDYRIVYSDDGKVGVMVIQQSLLLILKKEKE